MKVRAHVIISGKVQGVNFRHYTKVKASERNVNGWIKNLPDGRVEAIFEGEEKDVKEVIEFCKKGPPSSRVENVEVEWCEFKGEYKSFEIRY